jgi:hypothetical protein
MATRKPVIYFDALYKYVNDPSIEGEIQNCKEEVSPSLAAQNCVFKNDTIVTFLQMFGYDIIDTQKNEHIIEEDDLTKNIVKSLCI